MSKSAIRTYGFINARLRARLGLLISEETFNHLINAQTLEELFTYLRGTAYEKIEQIYRETGDIKLAELELFKQEVALLGDVLKSLTDTAREVVRTLLLKYEIENLKNILRIFFTRVIKGGNIENQILYIYRNKIVYDLDIDALLNASDIATVTELLKRTPYKSIIESEWQGVMDRGTLFFLEVKLDHFYYKNLMDVSSLLNQRDKSIFNRLIGVEIDINNINWIIRLINNYLIMKDDVKKVLIPGGYRFDAARIKDVGNMEELSSSIKNIIPSALLDIKDLDYKEKRDIERSLELLEGILDEIMLKEAKKALAGYPFSIGVILGYHVIKTRELRKIRAILNAKFYNMPPDAIRRSI